MKTRFTWAIVLLVATGALGVLAAQSSRGKTQLEAARKLLVVDGDLQGAIKQYTAIAETFKNDHAVAAEALLALAQAYETLDKGKSRKTYESLINQYPDQKDAVAVARGRLGIANAASARLGDRPVWTGPDVDLFGTVSPDGRFLSYVDWGGGHNLMLRDLSNNTSRPLTGPFVSAAGIRASGRPPDVDFSVISRDGAQIAFWWSDSLRVASLSGNDVPTAKVVWKGAGLRAFDWSPDNKFIAVVYGLGQIGVLSVENGTMHQLKSVDWGGGINKMVFSPDGRFLAYDLATIDRHGRSDIAVIAVDGSRETAIVEDSRRNYVMGWSAAGDLVFSSDRSRTRSLWAVRIQNGRPQGETRLVKENVRSTWSLGLTPAGTLYVWQPTSARHVGVAPFDPIQGMLGPASFRQFIDSRGRPAWSADGRHLLFISCGLAGGGPCSLFMRDGDAEPREVAHTLTYLAFPSLSPDGQTIVTHGEHFRNGSGIFLINARTGETSMLVRGGIPGNPKWSSDGRSIHYVVTRGQEDVLIEHEVASGQSKEIFRTPRTATENAGLTLVSPDGQSIGFTQHRRAEPASTTFVVTPRAGGPSSELLTLPGRNSLHQWQWAADSRSVIVQKVVSNGVELWHVPLMGSPRALDVSRIRWSDSDRGFHVSPDGRKIAFMAQAGESGDQVWALENFLPAQNVKK